MGKVIKNYSANCQICGKEKLNYQIRPAKVGALVLDVCTGCDPMTDSYDSFKEAIKILNDLRKSAQQNVNSPNVIIEPIEPAIQKGVSLLKIYNPSYFVGVSKIVAGTGNEYGHVSSGEGEDPTVVYINISRIMSESQSDKRESVISAALTIAHEVAHLKKFNEKSGFGSEGESQLEEDRVAQWIKNNEDKIKHLFV